MNERLMELYDQAIIVEGNGDYVAGELDPVKFAELIVQECVNIIEPTSHHQAFAQSYLGDVDGLELLDGKVKQIRQHFGVEK
jgi:hypothetical protein